MTRAKTPNRITQRAATEHEHARCRALGQLLDRIGDKWTVMVVGGLSHGPMRFNALLRLIGGVSHRMLTLTLRGLEHDGLVERTVYASVPPKVEYALTVVGVSLVKPLGALSDWVQENQSAIEAARASRRMARDTPAPVTERARPMSHRRRRGGSGTRTPL